MNLNSRRKGSEIMRSRRDIDCEQKSNPGIRKGNRYRAEVLSRNYNARIALEKKALAYL